GRYGSGCAHRSSDHLLQARGVTQSGRVLPPRPRSGLGTNVGAAGAVLGAGTGSTGDGPRAHQDTSNRRSGRPVRRLVAVGPRGVGRGDSPPVTATRPVRRSATCPSTARVWRSGRPFLT